jgi:hypothetical protein
VLLLIIIQYQVPLREECLYISCCSLCFCNKKKYLFQETLRRCHALDLYSKGTALEYWPKYRLHWFMLFIIFFSLTRRMPKKFKYAKKIRPHPILSLFTKIYRLLRLIYSIFSINIILTQSTTHLKYRMLSGCSS